MTLYLAREILAVSSLGFDLSTGFFQIQVRSGQCELNTRPIDLQSIALPTELYPVVTDYIYGALPLSYGRSNNVEYDQMVSIHRPPAYDAKMTAVSNLSAFF